MQSIKYALRKIINTGRNTIPADQIKIKVCRFCKLIANS